MTDTLFDLPDSPSFSKEAWTAYHGARITHYVRRRRIPYRAKSRIYARIGWGFTPDEALTDFAINNNLKLWNEE